MCPWSTFSTCTLYIWPIVCDSCFKICNLNLNLFGESNVRIFLEIFKQGLGKLLPFFLLTVIDQITVVAFQPVQLAQASFLQKDQTIQNVFLISVMLRWHRASVACKIQSL